MPCRLKTRKLAQHIFSTSWMLCMISHTSLGSPRLQETSKPTTMAWAESLVIKLLPNDASVGWYVMGTKPDGPRPGIICLTKVCVHILTQPAWLTTLTSYRTLPSHRKFTTLVKSGHQPFFKITGIWLTSLDLHQTGSMPSKLRETSSQCRLSLVEWCASRATPLSSRSVIPLSRRTLTLGVTFLYMR